MVWDATLTELKSATPLEVPPGGRDVFLPKEHPFPQADLPVRAEYVVRGQEGGRTVELVREVVPEIYRQRTDLRFPMRGGGWQVIAGPPQDNHRHRATTFRGRTLAMPGRYAMDIWRSYRGLYRTDGLTKEDYWGYGAPMYAPGVGRVVFVRKDADEPAFGEEIPGGESNTVVIDHQNGEYSFMLHLKKGSVAVEVGQWVEQGDLIGALGNSFDRWNVPHLHFEVRDSYIWPGEGLPVAFTGGRILGTEIQDGMLFSGAFFEEESLGPVLHVAADGSADYRTISDAMDVAVMGDTVRVAPGTYRETVWLKSGVVVLGSGYEGTRIEIDILANPVYAVNVSDAKISGFTLAYTGTESPVTVFVDSSQVTVANCRITNTTVSGVYAVNGSKVTVEGCLVEQNKGFGIAIYGGSEGYIWDNQIRDNRLNGVVYAEASFGQLMGNTITGNKANGLVIAGAGAVTVTGNVLARNSWAGIISLTESELEVRGNTIVENGTYGILVLSRSVASIVDNIAASNLIGISIQGGEEGDGVVSEIGYNDVWNNRGGNYLGFTSTPELDLSVDPRFVNAEAGDYHLWRDSPLLGAGQAGGTIGTFGILEARRLPGDVTDNGVVTAYDAVHILQHTVGLLTLTGEDSVVADVSGDTTISAYDASLVLQYVVGQISRLPVRGGQTTKVAYATRTVRMGEMKALSNGRMCLPILIDEMDAVVAGEMTLSIEENGGNVTVRRTHLTPGYLLASNVQNGSIRASFAGAELSTGSGPVLEVVSDAGLLSTLRLERVSLNEGRIPVRIEGVKSETPTVYRLSQNYPNPFNPHTVIYYELPVQSHVDISVYNMIGQKVAILLDKGIEVGTYSLIWDGKDDNGEDLASGVYLYRIEADGFVQTRKLVLMR